MPNLQLTKKKNLPVFRKMSIGTWRTAYDPSVYGTIEVKMDRAMEYIEAFREATGKRLTVTHLMARAVGEVLKKNPDANSILRYNRIYLRKQIGIFMQVVMTDEGSDKIDLSGIDADTGVNGNQTFQYVELAPGQALQAGQVTSYYDAATNTTVVEANNDGDFGAEFKVELEGNVDLSQQDFIL